MEGNRRVVVTGLGAVTPIGNDVATSWQSMVDGKCGIGPITSFHNDEIKATLAAEVKDFNPRDYMEKSEVLRSDRFCQLAVAAADQAVKESGVIGSLPADRVAVYFGSGIGGIQTFS
ncbi:MAG: beta-ketoacyl-[acyl-carrier-protein] synthase II, partial [Spirochaetes bacterium]|nr:beta-ketoacyl-[acyl-carrier-protein] synthase II [Candidatus Aphodenecus pullistercoris]